MGWFTLLVFFCLIVYSRRFRAALFYLCCGLVVLFFFSITAMTIYDRSHPYDADVKPGKTDMYMVPRDKANSAGYL
jgi:hypothetical protein